MAEVALRDAFRGRLDEATLKYAQAQAIAGTQSSQAVSSMSGAGAAIRFAAGDLNGVMAPARVGWSHPDTADAGALMGMAAGVAAGNPEWVREALVAFGGLERHGRLSDGQRAALSAALAAAEGRWQEARAEYLTAREYLADAGAMFWSAILNLSIGARAAGRFPEAADATTAAEQFFREHGAQSFLERYRESFVPSADDVTRPSAVVGERETTATG
jgi:hypothetical protein